MRRRITLPEYAVLIAPQAEAECAACGAPPASSPLFCSCLSPMVLMRFCSPACYVIHQDTHDEDTPALKASLGQIYKEQLQ